MVANNESHARKLACKGMAFVIRECCEATLFIYLSLATTYIETPAFAGVSMYCKYNIIHRDYGIANSPDERSLSEVLSVVRINKELTINKAKGYSFLYIRLLK